MRRILVLFLSLLFCTQLFAGQINEVIVLGDSLSDNGNLLEMLKVVPKSPPYYKGRFSNGPTWAEHVGKYFYDKFYVNYKIYAWGGATTILHSPAHDSFVAPITLDGELQKYNLESLFVDKSKVLYFIWIGANDYLYDLDPDMNGLVNNVVKKITSTMKRLMAQGAKNFVILNLPDLAATPYSRHENMHDRLAAVTLLHNKKLAEAINKLQRENTDKTILFMDIFTIFNNLVSEPQKYNQLYGTNITDVKESCWLGGIMPKEISAKELSAELEKAVREMNGVNLANFTADVVTQTILSSPELKLAYTLGRFHADGEGPCQNANQHIFWDDLHPTAAVHEILGKMVVQRLMEARVIG